MILGSANVVSLPSEAASDLKSPIFELSTPITVGSKDMYKRICIVSRIFIIGIKNETFVIHIFLFSHLSYCHIGNIINKKANAKYK